jgi:hypothetical protein
VAEAASRSEARQRRGVRLFLGLPFAALAVTALAVASGVPRARVRVLALDLLIACLATAVGLLVGRAHRRRARRQRGSEVPRGVRLRRPLWIRLDLACVALSAAGLLAALPAWAGWGSVSAGVLLTVSVIGGATMFSDTLMSPVELTFEEAGLRMHLGATSFQVPWPMITRVEAVGPEGYRCVTLHVADREAVVASTAPPTASARARVERLLSSRKRAGVSLLMMPWTAGLDGLVLERAIQAERPQEPRRGGALN